MSMEKDFAFLAGEHEDKKKPSCYICGIRTYRVCSVCCRPICKIHAARLKKFKYQERCDNCNN